MISACIPGGNLPGPRQPAQSLARLLCADRLDIGNNLEEILLADLPLERWHHRLVAGDDLRLGHENRVSDVTVVSNHETHVLIFLNWNGMSVDAFEPRGVNCLAALVTSRAVVTHKELLPLLGHRGTAALLRQPALVIGLLHDIDPAGHQRMVGAAILGAEEVMPSHLGGPEPERRVTSRQHVLLDPERRHEEAVDDVLRGHPELDSLTYRHMQLIDLGSPFRMLQVPHPLLADHGDFKSITRRLV